MINEYLVTFNLTTLATAIVGGVLLGYFAIVEAIETVLERWLKNGRVQELLELLPVLLLLAGIPIIVTFYLSATLTDALTNSPNSIPRSLGRGTCNIVFLLATSAGTALAVRHRRKKHMP